MCIGREDTFVRISSYLIVDVVVFLTGVSNFLKTKNQRTLAYAVSPTGRGVEHCDEKDLVDSCR